MAAISGLSMPMWLMLLSESLATFNQIRTNIAHGGSYTIFLDKMCNLIYSFVIVRAVSLVIGMPFIFGTYQYLLRHHNVPSLKRRFRIPSHGTSEKTAVHTKVELT
eukprot:scaffold294_cov193-Alexandrium_tamarense.AAC.4